MAEDIERKVDLIGKAEELKRWRMTLVSEER